MLSRRNFLQGLVTAGICSLMPSSATPLKNRERVLIMIHLNGGNDGLNTVIPYRDPLYRKLRPTLAIPQQKLLKLDQDLGFHPVMEEMRALYEEGDLGIVQGVGYENPNLSHFRSTEVWYSAAQIPQEKGWLSRAIDCSKTCDALTGVSLGHTPFALGGSQGPAPNLSDPARFQLPSEVHSLRSEYEAWSKKSGLQSHVGRLGLDSFEVAQKLSRIKRAARPRGPGIAKDLRLVLGLLEADLGIQFLHLSMSGFDTHDGQASTHANLLRRLSKSLGEFQSELERRGLADRVLTVLFSEFGRRPQENSGGGTDHGTAGPMFIVGKSAKGGIVGAPSRLDSLVNGNLRHHIDFRRVYSSLLRDWCQLPLESQLSVFSRIPIVKGIS